MITEEQKDYLTKLNKIYELLMTISEREDFGIKVRSYINICSIALDKSKKCIDDILIELREVYQNTEESSDDTRK